MKKFRIITCLVIVQFVGPSIYQPDGNIKHYGTFKRTIGFKEVLT